MRFNPVFQLYGNACFENFPSVILAVGRIIISNVVTFKLLAYLDVLEPKVLPSTSIIG
jgi:hypothetical protein